jgi:hypothetical protein
MSLLADSPYSAAQLAAIHWWSDNAYEFVNGALREGREMHWEREIHDALMAAARPAGQIGTLWRGTLMSPEQIASRSWTDPGWVSTSRDLMIGHKFWFNSRRRSSFARLPLLARIEVDADVPVVDVTEVLSVLDVPSAARSEHEVVIAPGCRFVASSDPQAGPVWRVSLA